MTTIPFPNSITVISRLPFGPVMLGMIDRLAAKNGLTRDQLFLIAISQWTAEETSCGDSEPIGLALPELLRDAERTIEDISA